MQICNALMAALMDGGHGSAHGRRRVHLPVESVSSYFAVDAF
jgi:hypothetical protein